MNDREMWRKWNFWDPKKEPLPEDDDVKKHRKITISTTCMGRTYDLKKTLIKNIMDNVDYPNIEFLVVNYNSNDDLDEWMKRYVSPWIEDGVVNYFKTTDPEFYEMGHSRNLCYKLATGDIVNNVDADNFTGCGFATMINKLAELCPKKGVFAKGKRSMHGRLGLYRDECIRNYGGYDEDLTGYGYDDHWLLIRAMEQGCKLMWWGDEKPTLGRSYSDRIKTPRSVVGNNMREKSWKKTENANKDIAHAKFDKGDFIANRNRDWGAATVFKNFSKDSIKI